MGTQLPWGGLSPMTLPMRQKELRIALVCYGGVSLAVYMHGVTKELWKLARASRAFHADEADMLTPSEAVYRDLLDQVQRDGDLRLRVLPDILTGASAGGINAIFLAQAIHSGQSLEPLTDLWLSRADIDELLDPEARPFSKVSKVWAQPLVSYVFSRPGNAVSDSVAPETRAEVRAKLSRLMRSRWFAPPFSGGGFSDLLANAFEAMRAGPEGPPLLPPRHPLDLFVTATDFHGSKQLLRLNSPAVVEEREHRLAIGFSAKAVAQAGHGIADWPELVLAARSTASFPGAFPPLKLAEIDALVERRGWEWPTRAAFLKRVMPGHVAGGTLGQVALIDGSVLVNAPFGEAARVLDMRPAQREVDRRFVYIDPRPDRASGAAREEEREIGFFRAIFGSLSGIPRQQPIRDNLEELAQQSRAADRARRLVAALRPQVEASVESLFGRTLFLDRPTAKRLKNWRGKAQQAAAEQAGFAYVSYAQAKFVSVVADLARALATQDLPAPTLAARIETQLREGALAEMSAPGGGASAAAIDFFKQHDLAFRVRRLRLLARRLARDWEADPDIPDAALDAARDAVFKALAIYFEAENARPPAHDGKDADDAGALLAGLSAQRDLAAKDEAVDAMLADALEATPKTLRRRMLLAYLGFPFYDIATLSLLNNEGLTEFEPIKVDRISPEDARSIRSGGTSETLRGTEFYNFGAFFSRAYRENDYLWGRLHGAERMIDLIASTAEGALDTDIIAVAKRRLFRAILSEEADRLTTDPKLVPDLLAELDDKAQD